jgi:hypothetical protein
MEEVNGSGQNRGKGGTLRGLEDTTVRRTATASYQVTQ